MRATHEFHIAILVSLLALGGCGSSELDRPKALELVQNHETMSESVEKLYMTSGGWSAGIKQGKWNENGELRVPVEEGIEKVNRNVIYPAASITRTVTDITGIAEAGDGSGVLKLIEFTWEFGDVPSLLRRYVRAGGTGTAVARIYDDGWRITNIDLKRGDAGFDLGGDELAKIVADERSEKARIQAAIEKERRDGQAYYDAVVEASKESNPTEYTVAQFKRRKKLADGVITLTDGTVMGWDGYGNPKTVSFYNAFEQARRDTRFGVRGCGYRRYGPAIEAGWHTNATWSTRSYRVGYKTSCQKVYFLFNSEEEGIAFRDDLVGRIRAWISNHGDLVVMPDGFSI